MRGNREISRVRRGIERECHLSVPNGRCHCAAKKNRKVSEEVEAKVRRKEVYSVYPTSDPTASYLHQKSTIQRVSIMLERKIKY